MKKVFLLIMVAATMLFTQCKKNEVVNPTGGNKVKITLTLDNNSKVDVNTLNGAVAFEEGDVIHVAYQHKRVGSLGYSGGVFMGDLEIEGSDGDYLYFYFLGNKDPEELVSEGDETLTVNIMDQSEELRIISFGKSDSPYSSSITNYTATLKNQCALVKFNVSSDVESNLVGQVGVKGLLNKVRVNLTTNVFEYSTVAGSEGIIKLNKVGKSGGEYWAVLLPQEDALPTGGGTYAYSTEGLYGYFDTPIQSVKPNGLYNDTVLCVRVYLDSEREFKIDGAGKMVRFSPGNLCYDYAPGFGYDTQRVHFERNQLDFSTVKPDANNRMCHFKWVDKGSQSWKVITLRGSGATLFCESGVDVDGSKEWFAMSEDQYNYMIKIDSTIKQVRNISSGMGAIITPYGYDGTVKDSYNETEWLVEESKGVVVLPAAGYWNYKYSQPSDQNTCRYWTKDVSTSGSDYYKSLYVNNLYVEVNGSGGKQEGRSIRLVKDCK